MQVSLPLLAAMFFRCLGYLPDIFIYMAYAQPQIIMFSSKIITFINSEGDLLLYYILISQTINSYYFFFFQT